VKLNVYHMTLFEKFVARLSKTPDGDGTLLDHSMLLFGSGMSESQNHERLDLPTLLVGDSAGGAACTFKPPERRSRTSLLVSLSAFWASRWTARYKYGYRSDLRCGAHSYRFGGRETAGSAVRRCGRSRGLAARVRGRLRRRAV